MRTRSARFALLLGLAQLLVLAMPAAAQRFGMVIGADAASELSLKPVTDEAIVRPPRRPDESPYLCVASFRSSPKIEHPWIGELKVVLFAGESKSTSVEVAPGIRAELTCSVDAIAPKAGAWLRVNSAAERKTLLSSLATFWLAPPGKRPTAPGAVSPGEERP